MISSLVELGLTMKNLLTLVTISFIFVGCANEPIIDRKGVVAMSYRKDLQECRRYADEVDVVGEAIEHGLTAVLVGGVFATIFGNKDLTQRIVGATTVSGGTRGVVKAEERKESVLHRCMKGRGYEVLG
jgi:hypothetical protein